MGCNRGRLAAGISKLRRLVKDDSPAQIRTTSSKNTFPHVENSGGTRGKGNVSTAISTIFSVSVEKSSANFTPTTHTPPRAADKFPGSSGFARGCNHKQVQSPIRSEGQRMWVVCTNYEERKAARSQTTANLYSLGIIWNYNIHLKMSLEEFNVLRLSECCASSTLLFDDLHRVHYMLVRCFHDTYIKSCIMLTPD